MPSGQASTGGLGGGFRPGADVEFPVDGLDVPRHGQAGNLQRPACLRHGQPASDHAQDVHLARRKVGSGRICGISGHETGVLSEERQHLVGPGGRLKTAPPEWRMALVTNSRIAELTFFANA